MNTPCLDQHGWNVVTDNGTHRLDIDWMDGPPAPTAILELLSCTCSRDCLPEICPCITNGLLCTDMCKLSTCANSKAETDQPVLSQNESDSEDDMT